MATRASGRGCGGIGFVLFLTVAAAAWCGRAGAEDATADAPSAAELASLEEQYLALARVPEYGPAFDTAKAIMGVHPRWVEGHLRFARILIGLEFYNDAQDMLFFVLAVDAKHREALFLMVMARVRKREFDEAVEYVDRLVATAPADPSALLLHAEVSSGRGLVTEAANEASTLLAKVNGPDRPAALARVVPLLLAARRFEDAERDATEWVGLQPSGDAFAYRAEARRAAKQLDEALADIVAGFKANGGKPTYHLMLTGARVLQDRGEAARAIVQLVDLLEMKPNDLEVERALDRAVLARQAEMRANQEKAVLDPFLVPPLDPNADKARVARWHDRAVVGNERIHKWAVDIATSHLRGERAAFDSYRRAMETYPTADAYAGFGMVEAVFKWEFPPGEGENDWQATAEVSARSFRIAAALAAVATAHRDERMTVIGWHEVDGYLAWAAFQDRVRAGKPSEGDWLLAKAHALEEEKDEWGAWQAYDRAERREHAGFKGPAYVSSTRITSNRVRCRAMMRGAMARVDAALASRDAKGATALAVRMQEAAKDQPDGWVAQAKVLRDAGDKVKADAALETAMSKGGTCEEGHWLKAISWGAANNRDEAMFEYNLAALGQQYAQKDDAPIVARAIEERDRLEKQFSRPKELNKFYADRANAAFAAKQWATAMACATRCTFGVKRPEAAAFEMAGLSAACLDLHARAAHDLKQAAAIDPESDVYSAWGNAMVRSGDPRWSISIYTTAIERAPNVAENYAARGRAVMDGGKDYAAAAADLRAAIARGDVSAETQLDLAECLGSTDPAAALAYCKEIMAKPGFPWLFQSEADVVERAKARAYVVAEAEAKRRAREALVTGRR